MRKSSDAVVAGHICLDIIPGFRGKTATDPEILFKPGHLVEVGKAVTSPGGPVSNTGLTLHRLGIQTGLMGKVGNDLFGRALCGALDANGSGLSSGMIIDDTADTSYTVILSPPGVDRIFFHCPGANDTYTVDDLQIPVIKNTRLFHFGYPPVMRKMYEDDGTNLSELFRLVKDSDVTTSLDMTLPDPVSDAGRADWNRILAATLPYVDIFLPSLEEILFMFGRDDFCKPEKACTPAVLSGISEKLMNMGAKIVGIKLGDQGLYIRTSEASTLKKMGRARPAEFSTWADREIRSPCYEVDVAGTTGSGDATIAGFLAGMLRGCSIGETVTMAVAAGACCVERLDATEGITDWEATRNRINKGWKRKELLIADAGWHLMENEWMWST
jgi:sugar/nucleoside kinase (ribokinase family)